MPLVGKTFGKVTHSFLKVSAFQEKSLWYRRIKNKKDVMKELWKKYREYIVIVSFMGVFFGIVQFGIVTLFRRNLATMNALQENVVDRKIFDEESRQIPNMKSQADTIAAESDQLGVLLSKDDVVRLAESLEMLGNTLDISVSMEAAPDSATAAFSAAEKKKQSTKKDETSDRAETDQTGEDAKKGSEIHLLPALPFARTVFVTVKATGKYPNIVRFLEKLDSAPTLLDVLSVNISPHEDETLSDALSNRPVIFSGAPVANTADTTSAPIDSGGTVSNVPNRENVDGSFLTAIYLNQS